MKARIISTTAKGQIKSGKLDLETALYMKERLVKDYPHHQHKIHIVQ